MDSEFEQMQYQHHFQDPQRQFQHQKQQMNCLTRFHSAPSAYFASVLDAVDSHFDSGGAGGGGGDFSSARPLSPETENIFARFMSGLSGGGENEGSSSQKPFNISENSGVQQAQFVPVVKQETEILQQQQQPRQQVVYHSQSKPPLSRPAGFVSAVSSAREGSFRGSAGSGAGAGAGACTSSIGGGNNINNITNSSGLTRHSSSPAGFFANILNMDNDYGVMKGMGNYGSGDGQINFSSQHASTSGMMSQTQNSDIEAKVFNNSSNNDSNYMTGYIKSSWNESDMSENFSNLDKSGGNEDMKTFSENQSGDVRNRPPPLAHHLSLPKTPAMEKLMQHQETVPCMIRAKRGFATHPRSIAERVRRTKISEKLRKLQALVPNMEEQTNTADMLDLAVEHIKDLQKQLKMLSDDRAKCTCL